MTYSTASGVCLSVSIVLYHSALEQLRSTLLSLFQSAQRASQSKQLRYVELILVDNSGDAAYEAGVQAVLRDLPSIDYISIKYIATAQNVGFGEGHNLAVSSNDTELHLVLNPDVELREDTLQAGLSALQQDFGIVLLSPAVVGTVNEPEYLCKSYPSVLVLVLRAFAPTFLQKIFRARLDKYEMRAACSTTNQTEVLLASGCFMLVRSAALKGVTGFDPRYFMYFEDFDLSLRLREKGRLIFAPAMQIRHHGGYAASKGVGHIWMFLKSGMRFFNRHGWKWI